jgi:hypothetical protein
MLGIEWSEGRRMAGTIDLIQNALNGLRQQISGYHQARTQAIVFLGGLAIGAVALALSSHKEWASVFAVTANIFFAASLYLAVFFRQMLDWAQAHERALLGELKVALAAQNLPLSGSASVRPGSSIFYADTLAARTFDGKLVRKRLLHDPPQNGLLAFAVACALATACWWIAGRPTRAQEPATGIKVEEALIVNGGGAVATGENLKEILITCPFALGSAEEPKVACLHAGTTAKYAVPELDCRDLNAKALLIVGGVDRVPLTPKGTKEFESNIQLAHARALTIKRSIEDRLRACPADHPIVVAIPRGPELAGLDALDRTVRVIAAE